MANGGVLKTNDSKNTWENINFTRCTHGIIWAIENKGVECAKKARLAHMRKFDLNQVDEPMVKDSIYSFLHVDEITKLQGQQMDLGMDGVAWIFNLPCMGPIISGNGKLIH